MHTKMKLVLPCSRDSEASGEQKEEMLLWYCADSLQAQGGRTCVCLCGGMAVTCFVFYGTSCRSSEAV